MKSFYTFILLLVYFTGYPQKTNKQLFVIQECYYQSWIAGIKGGGSGTDLHILFEEELPKDIVLSKIYFKNKVANPNKVTSKEYFFSFKDNINWLANEENHQDEQNIISNTEKAPLNITFRQAVLEYFYKGKKSFLKIKKVKEKEMLVYPSMRTNENDKN
ncbi:hypothetical protein AX766_06725 [Flavobacterium covae]|uniref:Uncharacterized protein n=1 Tax=Flavobacterium columnare TaxID=996 RepID=A0AA94JM76_9FLAO|nr:MULTISPECIES: hypothetical protein [Flavobacterium]AND64127.1 hypothetical protein AX766_06725 [Flavobacterium covae]MCH4829661.1 hypothetical protein [Flavobacterium columnare]MCH4831342.1 hypothetical protein [Flavobacterium columnare]OWP87374.1 hypothetical protein BWK60_04000 [Flavobacterium covae]QYS91812.1 hypothetical protein JJC04_03675 [Flavobacterium covae]